ncbi:MAG: hypothetical protein A2138_04785 [Deltaproteobacteria bacterium RBG_16_71_12]|nr:MAG: hypothetical protein A2138_04785 [Deltaproteobacteria bacterium RBG_16_71_12]
MIALSSCASLVTSYADAVAAAYDVDGPFVERVAAARAAAKAAPGDTAAALAFGRAVDQAVQVGALQRGKLTAADIDDAAGALDAASDDRSQALAVKGNLLLSAGRVDDGVAALEASLADKPNLWATPRLFPALITQGKADRVLTHCRAVRKAIRTDEERLALLGDCHAALGDSTWASKEDQQLFAAAQAQANARAAAERAAWDEQRAQERAALDASFSKPNGSGGGTASPAASGGGAATVSVQIRCTCGKTVPVFYGDKPKYGSGTRSSCSSNSVSSKTFGVGDMMWLIDDSENGLGSVSVSSATRTIEVGCTSISAR